MTYINQCSNCGKSYQGDIHSCQNLNYLPTNLYSIDIKVDRLNNEIQNLKATILDLITEIKNNNKSKE